MVIYMIFNSQIERCTVSSVTNQIGEKVSQFVTVNSVAASSVTNQFGDNVSQFGDINRSIR